MSGSRANDKTETETNRDPEKRPARAKIFTFLIKSPFPFGPLNCTSGERFLQLAPSALLSVNTCRIRSRCGCGHTIQQSKIRRVNRE